MDTVIYRNVTITNIRVGKMQREVVINYKADKFGRDAVGTYALRSLAKMQKFIDGCIALGIVTENGEIAGTHSQIDTAMFEVK
jgi:hypothetical protein